MSSNADTLKNDLVVLSGDLLLSELSKQCFPNIKSYQTIKTIDLQGIKNIDSAGIAYLAQIKATYSSLKLINGDENIPVLSKLYGVDFLFTK